MSIHQQSFSYPRRIASAGAWLAVSGLLLMSGSGIAQIIAMNDQGSSATVDLASDAGMYNWTVLGQNQLNQQWFWYRTDDGLARPINSIGGLTYQTATGLDGINHLTASYENSQLKVVIDYILTGGGIGSGNADIMESIVVTNKTGGTLNLNFYEYSNFNLLQSGNNTVEILGVPGAYNYVTQTSGSTAIQEGIVDPFASYAEAGYYNNTLNKLNTQANLELDGTTYAPDGNVTWAFQWYKEVNPNDGLEILKDKSLSIAEVPEPGTTALAVLGGLCLVGWTVRRRRPE